MAAPSGGGEGEPFRTQAAEAALGVAAGAQGTDLWLLDTLVNICKKDVCQTKSDPSTDTARSPVRLRFKTSRHEAVCYVMTQHKALLG